MAFHEDIAALKDHLDQVRTMGQLRTFLLEKDLKLIVTIHSTGFTCMDWNITQKHVAGILKLGMQVRISKLNDDEILLETRLLNPFSLEEIDPINQEELFETLKQGIKSCIKHI